MTKYKNQVHFNKNDVVIKVEVNTYNNQAVMMMMMMIITVNKASMNLK